MPVEDVALIHGAPSAKRPGCQPTTSAGVPTSLTTSRQNSSSTARSALSGGSTRPSARRPEVAESKPRWLDRRIAPSRHEQLSPEADQRREYRLERGGDRTEPDELAAAARAAGLNPRVFTKYRFEYVSPVAWMTISPDLVWTLDFSLANRGTTEERFAILMTEFHFAPDQPSFFSDDIRSFPGRVFLVNSFFVSLGGVDEEGWWARIYTSSRNLVPSIHFFVDSADGSESPSHPDVYFGRGDFEVFELPGVFVPPVIGPVEQ